MGFSNTMWQTSSLVAKIVCIVGLTRAILEIKSQMIEGGINNGYMDRFEVASSTAMDTFCWNWGLNIVRRIETQQEDDK